MVANYSIGSNSMVQQKLTMMKPDQANRLRWRKWLAHYFIYKRLKHSIMKYKYLLIGFWDEVTIVTPFIENPTHLFRETEWNDAFCNYIVLHVNIYDIILDMILRKIRLKCEVDMLGKHEGQSLLDILKNEFHIINITWQLSWCVVYKM